MSDKSLPIHAKTLQTGERLSHLAGSHGIFRKATICSRVFSWTNSDRTVQIIISNPVLRCFLPLLQWSYEIVSILTYSLSLRLQAIVFLSIALIKVLMAIDT